MLSRLQLTPERSKIWAMPIRHSLSFSYLCSQCCFTLKRPETCPWTRLLGSLVSLSCPTAKRNIKYIFQLTAYDGHTSFMCAADICHRICHTLPEVVQLPCSTFASRTIATEISLHVHVLSFLLYLKPHERPPSTLSSQRDKYFVNNSVVVRKRLNPFCDVYLRLYLLAVQTQSAIRLLCCTPGGPKEASAGLAKILLRSQLGVGWSRVSCETK